jgi:tetratricopeptide (TPR) repeat protein
VSPWRRFERVERDADRASNGWTDVVAGIEVYRHATEEHPDDAGLWFLYGGALAALERWAEAETVARSGLRAAGPDQDLWLLVLDALVAQGFPDLLARELEEPISRTVHPVIVPIYRARAEELKGAPDDTMTAALDGAYDTFCRIDHVDRAPGQPLLELGLLFARHGSRDRADHCFEVLGRQHDDPETAWRASAAGAALWDGHDEQMLGLYLDRLAGDADHDEEQTAQALADAAVAMGLDGDATSP